MYVQCEKYIKAISINSNKGESACMISVVCYYRYRSLIVLVKFEQNKFAFCVTYVSIYYLSIIN